MQGRFVLGPRLAELASAAGEDRLLAAAGPVLAQLRDTTGESAQLFRRQGDQRVCVAAAERPIGLRDTIPVGSSLTMKAGSAAQILLAWEDPDRLHRGLQGARFTADGAGRRTPARLGARASANASRASPRCRHPSAAPPAASWPPSPSRARSSGSPASPGACTPLRSPPPRPGSPRCWRAATDPQPRPAARARQGDLGAAQRTGTIALRVHEGSRPPASVSRVPPWGMV